MAKNWTLAEATKAVLDGDVEAISDIGKRFPNVAVAIGKMGNNEGALTIINALPEHVTARKVEASLKDGVEVSDVDDDIDDTDDDVEETPKKKRGRKSEEEKKAAQRERARKRREAKKAVEEDEDEDDIDEVEDDYSSMNAVELFKLCKKRGIDAKPKMKANEYVKLLKDADEKASDDSDDDWDDEEEEVEEKPVKKPGKRGRPPKKAEPVEEDDEDEADDDDEDWDI